MKESSVAESSSSLHAVGTPVWYRKDDKDHPWIEGQVTRLQGDQIVVQTADGEEHACSGADAPLRNAGPVVEDLVQQGVTQCHIGIIIIILFRRMQQRRVKL